MAIHSVYPSNGKRSVYAAGLVGAGVMAAVDEIIFHQILAWHHFYDKATPAIALLSDGLLHAGELVAIVTGFFLCLDLRRSGRLDAGYAWAGALLGAGAFQLFDGIINHKVLRLHQIRYGVDNLITYDVIWNLAGAILLIIGFLMIRRRRTTAMSEQGR